jgi:transposase-like protein
MKTIPMTTPTIPYAPDSTEGETQGARRATGVSPSVGGRESLAISPPDPEVSEIKPRRKFTAKYKLRILTEADACTGPGQLGAMLRREGLYFSNLTTWRKQRTHGLLTAMNPKKRGRKIKEKNPLAARVVQLENENQRLQHKLKRAELIIEAQKKISEILGIGQNLDDLQRSQS